MDTQSMSSLPASRQAPNESAAASDPKLLDDLLNKPICLHPALIRIGGSAASGILLSQLLYWSNKPKRDASGWIYKTEADWLRETGLSSTEQHRARRELKARGLIEEKRGGYLNRVHFRPCRARIAALLTGEAVSEASSPGVTKRTQNLRRGRAGAAQSVRQQEAGSVFSMFEFRGGNARKDDSASRFSGVQSSENRGTGFPKIGELASRKSGVPTHRLPQETTQETTHTPAPPPLSQQASECGKSEFSFDARRQYAEAHQLGKGWLYLSADGRYDLFVREFYSKQQAATSDERANDPATSKLSEADLLLMAENMRDMLAQGYLIEHLRAKFWGAMTGDEWRRVVEMLEAGTQQMAEGARVAV
jgi:hypothetical protein